MSGGGKDENIYKDFGKSDFEIYCKTLNIADIIYLIVDLGGKNF
ncbi:hypothetical protein [Methanobrevibacter sp.]|nr:hypothetical protein [Methanobrevibacter sp.]